MEVLLEHACSWVYVYQGLVVACRVCLVFQIDLLLDGRGTSIHGINNLRLIQGLILVGLEVCPLEHVGEGLFGLLESIVGRHLGKDFSANLNL